jgi:hypothetical protein
MKGCHDTDLVICWLVGKSGGVTVIWAVLRCLK